MLPRHPPSTSGLGLDNSPSGEEIPLCKKYIWGTCNKFAQCKYRHELDTEKMKDILQFCHDYQNRNGCTRENCKYLHATKEEQNIFLATGQIPRVLAERHAAMAATTSNMQSNAETIPQIAMFISESYMSQPPPAPWPPLPPPQAALPPISAAPPPPPPPSSPPRSAPALQPAQQTPQPPPPQTPTQIRPALATYSALPPQTPPVQFPTNQPPHVVPAEFDASRPPPPIPPQVQPTNSGELKRKSNVNGNAATPKIRKPEGSELSETHCENCIQREIRIDGYKEQMQALHNEEETQILQYKKKLQEYEIGRGILKSIVEPDLFIRFDTLIEGAQTSQLDNPGGSFISGSRAVSKQVLLQLFQMLLGDGPRNVIDQVPSTSHMDETLHSLTSLSRRHSVPKFPNSGTDLIKFVTDTLRNNSGPESAPSVEQRPNEQAGINNRTNRFLANGQKPQPTNNSEPARYSAPVYSGACVQTQGYGSRMQQAMPTYSAAGPSGYATSAAGPAPPPAGYPAYHPAVPPPPNRPYYGPGPAGPSTSHMLYYGAERATGPGVTQGMPPLASPVALRPSQANAPNYNFMGRYPQPPSFPPHQ